MAMKLEPEFDEHPIMKLYIELEDYYQNQYRQAWEIYLNLERMETDMILEGGCAKDPVFYAKLRELVHHWLGESLHAREKIKKVQLERLEFKEHLKAKMKKNENAQEGEA